MSSLGQVDEEMTEKKAHCSCHWLTRVQMVMAIVAGIFRMPRCLTSADVSWSIEGAHKWPLTLYSYHLRTLYRSASRDRMAWYDFYSASYKLKVRTEMSLAVIHFDTQAHEFEETGEHMIEEDTVSPLERAEQTRQLR